jgi:hypothetical protein
VGIFQQVTVLIHCHVTGWWPFLSSLMPPHESPAFLLCVVDSFRYSLFLVISYMPSYESPAFLLCVADSFRYSLFLFISYIVQIIFVFVLIHLTIANWLVSFDLFWKSFTEPWLILLHFVIT